MKKLKKLFWLLFLKALPIMAKANNSTGIPKPPRPNGVPSNLSNAITTISNTLLGIIGTISVLFLIIGGFQYITSAGNPDSIMKAKNTILYAVLGIIFSLLSYAIVNFIITEVV